MNIASRGVQEEKEKTKKVEFVSNQVKLNDQGEARLGPGYQVPGFPGCQGESPLGSW